LDSPEYQEKYGDEEAEELRAVRRRVLSKHRVCNSEDEDVDSGVCLPLARMHILKCESMLKTGKDP
jgi:hypothetical protein